MEGMIGLLHEMQRRRCPEAFDDRLEQRELRKLVAGALDEEHGDPDIRQVPGPCIGRLAGRMQRKAEEGKSVDAGKRRARLRLRRHAAAERSATGKKREPRTA